MHLEEYFLLIPTKYIIGWLDIRWMVELLDGWIKICFRNNPFYSAYHEPIVIALKLSIV